MERPKGRPRDKMDIAVDCLCRMSLGTQAKLCHAQRRSCRAFYGSEWPGMKCR